MAERPVNIENSDGVVTNPGNITAGGDFMVNSQKTTVLYDPEAAVWKRRFLALTPYAVPEFFGSSRDAELDELEKQLTSGRCLVLVNGVGGIGKTSIAAAWCKRQGEYYTHILWVSCGEGTLGSALLSCGLMEQLFRPDTFKPGTPDDDRLDRLLAALCSAGERGPCLLVLDNANQGEDLTRQHKRLTGLAAYNWAVLITSRAEWTGLPELKIGTLPPPQARQLFLDYFPAAGAEPEHLLDRLLMAVGYNTLLIEVLAKHLAVRQDKGKKALLSDLIDSLEKAGVLALPVTDTVDVDWQNRHGHTPEAILEALFDLSALDAAAQDKLLRLALLPTEPHLLPWLYRLFEVATDSPEEASFDESLKALARAGWLEWQAGVGYRMHPLVSSVVCGRLLRGYDSCADLVECLIDIHQTAHLDERANYAGAARSVADALAEENNARVAELNLSLINTLMEGDYKDVDLLLDRAYRLLKNAGETADAAWSYLSLGDIYQNLGGGDVAWEEYVKSLKLWEALFTVDPESARIKHGLAASYQRLGDIYQETGELDVAQGCFEQCLRLLENLFIADPESAGRKFEIAVSYERLGRNFEAQGKLEEALGYFEKYLQLSEELFTADPQFKGILGISHYRWGALQTKLGHPDEARQHLEKALSIFEELAKGLSFIYYFSNIQKIRELLKLKPLPTPWLFSNT